MRTVLAAIIIVICSVSSLMVGMIGMKAYLHDLPWQEAPPITYSLVGYYVRDSNDSAHNLAVSYLSDGVLTNAEYDNIKRLKEAERENKYLQAKEQLLKDLRKR